MLKEILANQREMIQRLKILEAKVDGLHDKLNEISHSLDEIQDLSRAGFAQVQATLARYAANSEDIARAHAIVGLEQTTIEKARNDLEDLNASAYSTEFRECL